MSERVDGRCPRESILPVSPSSRVRSSDKQNINNSTLPYISLVLAIAILAPLFATPCQYSQEFNPSTSVCDINDCFPKAILSDFQHLDSVQQVARVDFSSVFFVTGQSYITPFSFIMLLKGRACNFSKTFQ